MALGSLILDSLRNPCCLCQKQNKIVPLTFLSFLQFLSDGYSYDYNLCVILVQKFIAETMVGSDDRMVSLVHQKKRERCSPGTHDSCGIHFFGLSSFPLGNSTVVKVM